MQDYISEPFFFKWQCSSACLESNKTGSVPFVFICRRHSTESTRVLLVRPNLQSPRKRLSRVKMAERNH